MFPGRTVQANGDPGDEQPEPDERERWEHEQFVQLGFGDAEAWQLAAAGVSWHEALRLVPFGCSWKLAVRILL